jgi:hypothetical protein
MTLERLDEGGRKKGGPGGPPRSFAIDGQTTIAQDDGRDDDRSG